MEVKTLTNDNFKEFIGSNEAVVVDFWAPWCGPCRMIGPVLEKLCNEGVIQVGKVNVDDEQDLAVQYRVQSIPTVIIFKNGQAVKKAVGVQSEDSLLEMLK